MKKVVFFSTYFLPYTSGAITAPYIFLKYLSKTFDVTILTFHHDLTLPKNEFVCANMRIIRMPFEFKISKGFISFKSVVYFYRALKGADLLIINIPNFEAWPLTFINHFFRIKSVAIYNCSVTLSKDILSQIIQFFLNLSILYQILNVDKVITYTKDYFDNNWVSKFIDIERVVFILPPPELPEILLPKIKKDNVFRIGFAGRVSEEKGLLILISAINQILENKLIPKDKLSLLLAGPPDSVVVGERKYQQKVRDELLKSNINFERLGFLDRKSLFNFYRKIDVLVLPSTNSTEAYGIVQVEAMLSGTPVITSDLPGVRVPIQLSKMGIITKPGDVELLKDALFAVYSCIDTYSSQDILNNTRNIFANDKSLKSFVLTIKNLLNKTNNNHNK